MNELSGQEGRARRSAKGINAVEIGYRVLMAVQLGPGSVSLSDIADRAGLKAGAAHNYLTSLIRTGLVEREHRGRYRLGPSAFALSQASFRVLNGYEVMRNEARALHDLTGESVSVAVWSQGGPISIYMLQSHLPNRLGIQPGQIPLLSSGSGLLYLAYLPESETRALVESELAANHDPRGYAAIVSAAREEVIPAGSARFNYSVPTPFSWNVPIWSNENEIPFALSLIVHEPVDRATEAQWLNALKAAADRASYLAAQSDARGPQAIMERPRG